MVAYPARPDRREPAQKQGALRELIRARRDPHEIISEDIVDRGAGLKAGIMIGNSEVGMVSVEPFVFRKSVSTT